MRRAAFALALVGVTGCISADPVVVGAVSILPVSRPIRILQPDVRRRHCSGRLSEAGDLGEAVDRAIASVPGANVLVDVSVFYQPVLHPYGVELCVDVVGDAGVVQ